MKKEFKGKESVCKRFKKKMIKKIIFILKNGYNIFIFKIIKINLKIDIIFLFKIIYIQNIKLIKQNIIFLKLLYKKINMLKRLYIYRLI